MYDPSTDTSTQGTDLTLPSLGMAESFSNRHLEADREVRSLERHRRSRCVCCLDGWAKGELEEVHDGIDPEEGGWDLDVR